ncbi:SCO family protein [Tahibacter harae]|uniref:SCO family protein n=1 Tax=Tahibacter harae TaxID=2963937 RepID=A0ABT1QWF1_9GAMM|nr:SCO family protein [Tahibacter harae]MCQ4166620.1 SCO family protein [Tahibacter harae]
MKPAWTGLLAGLLLNGAACAAGALPGDSLYHFDARFSDQNGHEFTLRERRGKAQIVTLFYTSCRYVCPLIIDSAKNVEQALTPAQRERLAFLIVSLDPDRDDTAALHSVVDKRRLDPARWTLARTDKQSLRQLAALIDIRYRELADGEFNHTSALVLVDAEGRIAGRSDGLEGGLDAGFVGVVKAVLGK